MTYMRQRHDPPGEINNRESTGCIFSFCGQEKYLNSESRNLLFFHNVSIIACPLPVRQTRENFSFLD